MINPEDHLNIAYKLAHEWNTPEYFFPKEERISVALLGLTVAAKGFDESKGYKFSTYAHTTIRNHLAKFAFEECRPAIRIPRSNRKDRVLPKVEESLLDMISKEQNSLVAVENKEFVNGILSRCTPQQKFILNEILKGKLQYEVAKTLKCSNQHVSEQYNRILRRERKRLNENSKNPKTVA